MKKMLAILCVAALPAVAQPAKNSTKTITNTNPAGMHSMTMTKSGTGQSRTISKTMTNTEGNRNITRSSINGPQTHLTRRHKKSSAKVASKSHRKPSARY